MANAEAGSAYVSIIPSMKGFSTKLTDGIKGAVTTAAKVAATAAAAGTAAFAAVGKQALQAYSEYEQNVGGVEKIFGDAASRVKQYAADAYRTAGVSQNDYMQQVTAFSQSLKQSFGGDVVKAAERANTAMVDMADNVSIFGSNMEDVQNAYQGFAKQNYTMLDNLKLGYGGTKQEMERLIADANEWERANGRAGDLTIEKFGDVVQAIHDIQEQQGIAGNTAQEAARTIAGSVQMAKAAWENWLTGLADEDADMGDLTQRLIDSIQAVAENVGPHVRAIGQRVIENLPAVARMVGDAAYRLLTEALSEAWGLVSDAVSGLGIALPDIDASGFDRAIQDVVGTLEAAAPAIAAFVGAMLAFEGLGAVTGAIGAVSSALAAVGGSLVALAGGPVAIAVATVAALAGAFAALYATNEGFRESVDSVVGPALDAMRAGLEAVAGYLQETFGPAIQAVVNSVGPVLQGLGETFAPVAEAIRWAFESISSAASTSLGPALQVLQPILQLVATVLGSVLGPALQAVAEIVAGAFAAAFTVAGSVVSGAMQVVGGAVQAVVGAIEVVVGAFVGIFTGDWSMAADGACSVVQGMSNVLAGIMNALLGTLGGILNGIASVFTGVLNGITGVVSGVFSGVASTISSKIGDAKSAVSSGLSHISGLFSGLHLQFPHIKLPHFSIVGSFSLDPPSVPTLGIDWYAKGGIVRRAAVLGERGAEAIVPYSNSNIRPWAAAMATAMGEGRGGGDATEVVSLLRRLVESDRRVYLDGDLLVGGIAARVDGALGARRLALGR